MPPFIAQESPDTCVIACWRMVLASQGIERTEDELVQDARMEPGGMNPEELVQLARLFDFEAVERQLDRLELFTLIEQERFPIVFLYRRPFDRVDEAHAVIPVGLSSQYVTFLDPLRGKRRVSIRKFEEARRLVGRWVVAWASRGERF
jgi:ABC-type bacteriocin/lantibiotic exporter with double-glycine peptidase domain